MAESISIQFLHFFEDFLRAYNYKTLIGIIQLDISEFVFKLWGWIDIHCVFPWACFLELQQMELMLH